ncbi:MAG: septum formation family protein [Acidimicrobiales bacterium]|nr:septum formation family protein [Acidimicrobiales bacterium]
MRRPTLSVLVAGLALGTALAAGACADTDPPTWLEQLGAPTTTTAAPAATTTTVAGGGPATTSAAATPITDLVAGDCVDGSAFSADSTGEATEAQVVDCAAAHDGEVVGVITYTEGPEVAFPGADQVAAYADEQCAIAFEAYVGVAYGTSPLSMVSLWPTEASWSGGDREAVCVAFDPAAQLTATVAGSAAGA